MKRNAVLIFLMHVVILCKSQTDSSRQYFNFRFQQSIVTQYHPDFSAKYSGERSLLTHEQPQTSLTSTLFLGGRIRVQSVLSNLMQI